LSHYPALSRLVHSKEAFFSVGEEERNFQFLILNFRDDWALLGTLEICETAVPLFQTEKIRRDYGILSHLYSKHFDVPNNMSVFETDFRPDFSAVMIKNGKNSVGLTVYRPIHCALRDQNRCDRSVSNCDNANFLTLVFYGKMLSSQFGSSLIFRKFGKCWRNGSNSLNRRVIWFFP